MVSGKRDSNPRPLAWEAKALPTELLPQKKNNLFANVKRYLKIDKSKKKIYTFFLKKIILQFLQSP